MKKVLFLFLFLFFIGGGYFGVQKLIRIEKIDCSNQYGPCSENLEGKVQGLEGDYFKVKTSLGEILSKEASVENFSLFFKLPSTLKVYVVEKKSEFALFSREKETFALVDKEGRVLSLESESALPFVETQAGLPGVGETLGQRDLFALDLLLDLFDLYQVREGKITGESFEVFLKSGEKVIFPLEGDRRVLVASLTAILSRLNSQTDPIKIDGGSVREIDLRFQNPVLR